MLGVAACTGNSTCSSGPGFERHARLSKHQVFNHAEKKLTSWESDGGTSASTKEGCQLPHSLSSCSASSFASRWRNQTYRVGRKCFEETREISLYAQLLVDDLFFSLLNEAAASFVEAEVPPSDSQLLRFFWTAGKTFKTWRVSSACSNSKHPMRSSKIIISARDLMQLSANFLPVSG